MNGPFDPSDVEWTRLSPRVVPAWRLTNTVTGLVIAAIGVVVWYFTDSPWPLIATVVGVGSAVIWWFLVARQVRAWGYAEREDDLLVRHGILFRSLVVVPYGRMQFVDVSAGPLDRAFGIAKVQLHTASSATDATIPGLSPEEASRLRDRLASRGESRLAGL